MKKVNTPKEESIRYGANYPCPRCSGRGMLYLADANVKDVTDDPKHRKKWSYLTK